MSSTFSRSTVTCRLTFSRSRAFSQNCRNRRFRRQNCRQNSSLDGSMKGPRDIGQRESEVGSKREKRANQESLSYPRVMRRGTTMPFALSTGRAYEKKSFNVGASNVRHSHRVLFPNSKRLPAHLSVGSRVASSRTRHSHPRRQRARLEFPHHSPFPLA